jgi:hypothetical protein
MNREMRADAMQWMAEALRLRPESAKYQLTACEAYEK